jgi:proton-coupled amino acid transporter
MIVLSLSSCILQVALAAAVPKIDLFISLTGAVATSTLALIAPAIIHTTVFWKEFEGTSGKLKLARNIFLLILGILGMVVATVLSVKDIVEFFVNPPSEGNVLQCNNTTLLKL